MIRPLLRPLSPLYSAVTAARNMAYDRVLLRPRRLPATVLSIGNLSTGGTGKTPLIAALAGLLVSAGRRPIILSRGYGRQSSQVARVDPAGNALQFGDEPLLLANSLPSSVPIYVGADRYRVGMLAAEENPVTPDTLFLLDDGFQHRQLAREIDIVLLSASDLTDSLLPAGNLREPLASLARADVLVFREEDAALVPEFLKRFQHPSCSRPVVWKVRRTLDLSGIADLTVPAVAFAGIAHPREFFSGLRARGLALPATLSFPDHHPYTFADVTRILASLQLAKSRTLLTTEKDLVRLDPRARASMEACATLVAVPLLTELDNPELCLHQIDALCVRQS
jgi:tetraacyldisaccharide 4'-kinase